MASITSAARVQTPRDASSPVQRSGVRIAPFDGPLGAEVIGLNLSQPLDADAFARLHRAHLDHHVLVFRDQRISPAQQVEFSRRFGALQIHVLRNFQLRGHPEVLVVSNIKENGEPIGLGDAGHDWHSDLSYKETPSLGSLLHAQQLPSEGGDTSLPTSIWHGKRCPNRSRARCRTCVPNTVIWPGMKHCAPAIPGARH